MYSSREVAELVGMSTALIRHFARRGFLSPERSPRNHYRFSFQDLTFLRTTNELLTSGLPRHRVHRALRELRRQHPRDRPLSELRLTATNTGVVARDTTTTWDLESGQVMLDFSVQNARVSSLTRHRATATRTRQNRDSVHTWFEHGCSLESSHPAEARHAYRRALALDPVHAGARVNLGRSLHNAGHIAEAIEHYRIVLTAAPDHAIAAYNLGVALEDVGRRQDAFTAYAQALASDPDCAEAHFNIAKLYEQGGDQLAALRHLRAYSTLVKRR